MNYVEMTLDGIFGILLYVYPTICAYIYILGHSSPKIKRNYILHEEHKVHYFFSNENEILLHCKSIVRENVLDFYENNVKTKFSSCKIISLILLI